MELLGLLISIFIYLTAFLLLFGYSVLVMFNKYTIANKFIFIAFIHLLFTVMFLSWSLIVMNGGYDIVFSLRIDYSYLLILFIPALILIEFQDYRVRKCLVSEYSGIFKVSRFLLPTFVLILFYVGTLIFYFNCHYFAFLQSIWNFM